MAWLPGDRGEPFREHRQRPVLRQPPDDLASQVLGYRHGRTVAGRLGQVNPKRTITGPNTKEAARPGRLPRDASRLGVDQLIRTAFWLSVFPIAWSRSITVPAGAIRPDSTRPSHSIA